MVIAVAYGLGVAAFAALLLLILLGTKPEGAGRHIVLACGITLLWTAATAASEWRMAGLAQALETGRAIGWLYFLGAVLGTRLTDRTGRHGYLGIVALTIGVVVIGNDLRFFNAPSAAQLDLTQIIARVAMAVTGILLVENIFRNTSSAERWHVAPLCIALGGLFGYDLFLYSDALLFRRVDVTLFAARGAVMALIVPPLVLTLVRNRDWRIDIHVSRQFVFHTATLVASGVFLLSAAAVALVLRRIPGDWGALFQAVFLCGSVLVLLTVLSSGSFRSRLKGLLVRNLFSHRYDYRLEWMNFVDTVSGTDAADSLQVRVIRAIADITDSPGGALWLKSSEGQYVPSHAWNMHFGRSHQEPVGSPFVAAFKVGLVIQELMSQDAAAIPEDGVPEWARGEPKVWLAVPLQHRTGLFGFITLAPPRAPSALDWESRNLLIAIGKQAASYLSEEQVTRDLADARLLAEFSHRFAFVAHDIKNLVSQLTMTVTNARTHGSDPEFREDMLRTLENSVARMRELLSKLRPEKGPLDEQPTTEADAVIASVVKEIGGRGVTVTTEGDNPPSPVAIGASALKSALTHLITNALEASTDGAGVTVRSRALADYLVIEVQDHGPGMDERFIQEELFRPFRSTKSRGYGIGAFQVREIVREAAGDLEVLSTPGHGTTMRIRLPYREERHSDARRIRAVGT